jgi:hypothetical protein
VEISSSTSVNYLWSVKFYTGIAVDPLTLTSDLPTTIYHYKISKTNASVRLHNMIRITLVKTVWINDSKIRILYMIDELAFLEPEVTLIDQLQSKY